MPGFHVLNQTGDLLYGGAGGASARLPGNTSTTRKFLRQTGTGSTSAAPEWDTLSKGDVTDLPAISTDSTSNAIPQANGSGKLDDAWISSAIARSGGWTASRAMASDGSGNLTASSTTTAELMMLSGATAGTAVASKTLVCDSGKGLSGLGHITSTGTVTAFNFDAASTCTITNVGGYSGWRVRSFSNNIFQVGGNNFFRAGGTLETQTATPSGAFMGHLSFRGHTGSSFFADDNARILSVATETHSPSAAGTALIFYSTPTGLNVMSESLRCAGAQVGIGLTGNPTAPLDVGGNTVRVRTSRTPASASATGSAGEICWDSNYLYICVAANTWKRAALSTW